MAYCYASSMESGANSRDQLTAPQRRQLELVRHGKASAHGHQLRLLHALLAKELVERYRDDAPVTESNWRLTGKGRRVADEETTMPEPPDRVHENRLRRMAERQGLRLTKSRRRDRRALDFGRLQLVHATTQKIVHTGRTLDEVEAYLTRDPEQ